MKKSLNEQIGRMKQMMNLKEDDSQNMVMLQQDTEEFNEKVGEDLTPEQFKEIICTDPEDIELPSDITNEEKEKLDQVKEKLKTATFPQLIEVKKQLKELKRKAKQTTEQVAETALVSILGVSMPPAFAIAIGGIIFIMVLSFLGRLFKFKKTTTYYCDGTRSRGLFGLLRW